jgi:hypothetical protein
LDLCPRHNRELLAGFCDVFVKRAAIGHVGLGTEPTPIQHWHRKFAALPEDEQLKLSAFASIIAPVLYKQAGAAQSALRAVGSLDDVAPAVRSVERAAPALRVLEGGGEAAGYVRPRVMVDMNAPPSGVPFNALPPPPTTPAPSVLQSSLSNADLPGTPIPSGGASVGAVPPVPTTPGLPSWANRALGSYKGMKPWQKGMFAFGVGMPLYQYSQGQIGPGELAAGIGGSVLTMGMGMPMQLAGSLGAPMLAGRVIDPALGWRPMEQRLQEAQQSGQQQMLSAVQQQMGGYQIPQYAPGGYQFSANGLAMSGPQGTQLRPDLGLPFQMAQREAIERRFPGL